MDANPLSSGIYSVSQAARLLNASPAKIRGWLVGHHDKKQGPIIKREISLLEHSIVLSFINLIEARFISAFSKHGIPVVSIRAMADEAKRILNSDHPFASKAIFGADKKSIFIIGEQGRGRKRPRHLYDLRGRNVAMYDILYREIEAEIVYGPSGLAQEWYPRKDIAPAVVLHPKLAFGQPSLRDYGVPTSTLYATYLSERKNAAAVARWFDVPIGAVQQAIKFEEEMSQTLH